MVFRRHCCAKYLASLFISSGSEEILYVVRLSTWTQGHRRPKQLCGHALITVMKTAELRDGDDSALAGRPPRQWTLLLERPMGTGFMVVAEIQTQDSFQMPGVEDHEMV